MVATPGVRLLIKCASRFERLVSMSTKTFFLLSSHIQFVAIQLSVADCERFEA